MSDTDRRSDDIRIVRIEEMLEAQQKMWVGEGLEPGLKDVVLQMHRTLHGTQDEDGVVGVQKDHERRIKRIEKYGSYAAGGAGVLTFLWNAKDWLAKIARAVGLG